MLTGYGPAQTALLLFAFALAGALTGWILVRLLQQHVDDASLDWCKSTILPDETVVIARVRADDTPRVLAILRDVEAEAPVTFSFYSPPPLSAELTTRPLWPERPSGQRLAENAARLARSIAVSRKMEPRGPSFLHRLREIERTLEWANDSLTMGTEAQQTFALSSEWLLDNAYLIREQVTELRGSLPRESYGELPLIASGPEAGLPRVYRLAAEIVAESGGALDRETIRKFLVAFQEVAPLDIAELWAVPPMLRLRLVESLRLLAIQVGQQQGESEEADFWANRLITAARHNSSRLLRMMEQLVEQHPEPSAHFAHELVAHLYDEEAALPMVTGWLERFFRAPLHEVMQQEHVRQTVQQTALANLINSCRRLAQIEWRELFESTSRAESELAADPAGIYARTGF